MRHLILDLGNLLLLRPSDLGIIDLALLLYGRRSDISCFTYPFLRGIRSARLII